MQAEEFRGRAFTGQECATVPSSETMFPRTAIQVAFQQWIKRDRQNDIYEASEELEYNCKTIVNKYRSIGYTLV
jgi:hypothetical protein